LAQRIRELSIEVARLERNRSGVSATADSQSVNIDYSYTASA
jgi:hypothetical protein